ncbi:MAG TPA: peptidylprolyl isomerase [Chthoniobacterales bacterium]
MPNRVQHPPAWRWMREPLLHFLLLGALIFVVNGWRERRRPAESGIARIEVTAETLAWLSEGFSRQWHRAPDVEELRGLVNDHVREEVLYREALALGLDRNDTIVRRRLAQKMEFLTDDITGAATPDDAALQRFFAENAAHYAKPGRLSFRHVYFNKEKRGAGVEAAAREALGALKKGASDEALGDPFLHGFEFAERESPEIAALFGSEFAAQIVVVAGDSNPGDNDGHGPSSAHWLGPIASSYGLHLVRVDAREQPRPVTLDEVRATVARDFSEERRRTANREVFERLRARYEIAVDEAAITKAAAPSNKTAQR